MRPLLFIALLCLGCQSADDRVTIEFWGMGREGEVVAELLPAFERENPGIRVEVQQLPWTAAHAKLLTAYAGDALPDLFQLGNTWMAEFGALEALEPLAEYVARSPVFQPNDFFGGIWATNVLDEQLYGIPWYVDTRLLFYRKDLLQKAGYNEVPETWAEWEAAMRAVKDVAGPGNYAALLPINEFEPLLILGIQQDEALLRDGGRYGNFRSADFRETFTFYINLFRNELAPSASNTQISNVWQEFGRGFFSFYITGPWQIGEFRRRLPDSLQGTWMTAPMPGPDGPGLSVAGGSSLVISRESPHKEAAWKLVEFLSRPDTQVRFHELTGNLPPREAAWEDDILHENEYAHAFREQLRRVEPTPLVPEWERIVTEMRLAAERVILGQKTIDQALTDLDRTVDTILEKRRWMLARYEESKE